jgi:hypothetical protein
MIRTLVVLSVGVFLCISSNAQSYQSLVHTADSLYNTKQYEQSWLAYSKAFSIRKDVANDLYNGACTASITGKQEDAFTLLYAAIDQGWINIQHLQKDTDLTALHAHPRWNTLISDLQKKINLIESGYNKSLQQELLAILDDDQTARNAYVASIRKYGRKDPHTDSIGKVVLKKDSTNILKVVRILDKYGWVGPELVGDRASTAVFLVVQHADLQTQLKYLPMARKAAGEKKLKPEALALLEDRIAIRQGKKQVYGSQIGADEKTGAYYIMPVEDPMNLDQRRMAVGLSPMAEYVKTWKLTWNPKEHADKTSNNNSNSGH